MRGEGQTAETAVRALVERRASIEATLAGKAQVRTGRLAVSAARDKACDGQDEDDDRPRLSSGACAIRGYIATLDMTARVKDVGQAGTLLGDIARRGATEPSLGSFELANLAAAKRAAVADAVRDARGQAEAIAEASRVVLGRIRRVEDQRTGSGGEQDIVVTANRAPASLAESIAVRLAPEPIETMATLIVEFEVGGGGP